MDDFKPYAVLTVEDAHVSWHVQPTSQVGYGGFLPFDPTLEVSYYEALGKALHAVVKHEGVGAIRLLRGPRTAS